MNIIAFTFLLVSSAREDEEMGDFTIQIHHLFVVNVLLR